MNGRASFCFNSLERKYQPFWIFNFQRSSKPYHDPPDSSSLGVTFFFIFSFFLNLFFFHFLNFISSFFHLCAFIILKFYLFFIFHLPPEKKEATKDIIIQTISACMHLNDEKKMGYTEKKKNVNEAIKGEKWEEEKKIEIKKSGIYYNNVYSCCIQMI